VPGPWGTTNPDPGLAPVPVPLFLTGRLPAQGMRAIPLPSGPATPTGRRAPEVLRAWRAFAAALRLPHNHLYLTRAYDTATPSPSPSSSITEELGGLSVTIVFERSSNREANCQFPNSPARVVECLRVECRGPRTSRLSGFLCAAGRSDLCSCARQRGGDGRAASECPRAASVGGGR
jgi:hypothetical protein